VINSSFFQMFWLVFIGLMGLLGISLAMTAGFSLATRDVPSALVATALTGACALLCGIAHMTYREAQPPR